MWDLAAKVLERDLQSRQQRRKWGWARRRVRSLTLEYYEQPCGRRLRRLAGAAVRMPAGPVVVASLDGAPLLALSVERREVVGRIAPRGEDLVAALNAAASWFGEHAAGAR